MKIKPTPEMNALLKSCASQNQDTALAAQGELAKALELPLRQGVMSGDITNGIFETIPVMTNSTAEFPLDFLAPGTEKEFTAYSIPNHGYIPQKHIEGDYVMVPTYDVGNSIDWNIKYARDARWDIVGNGLSVMNDGFVKKVNDDSWHTLITAAADRNIVVLDSDAATGQFTKRLVSLLKLVMRRNGGGNSTSINRGKLTDLYVSPEAMEDIRSWNVDQVDEITRREIFVADGDNALNRIFGINLHDLDELGEGQEYQLFYDNELGGSLPAGKVELVVGLDMRKRDSFVMPVREELQVFEDPTLHRQRRQGYYGWMEFGLAVLDNRRVILGAV